MDKLNIYHKDHPWIVMGAFRYGLGRMTYVTEIIADYIVWGWEGLPESFRSLIQQEIREALENDQAGMECDRKIWAKILELPVGEANG